ncbi:MAG: VOC family protein [bacterium]|nr:VOC family protein [bacterium]
MKPQNNIITTMDHLVIGAVTLQQGVDYVGEKLGIRIPPGGRHTRMGTHNHVMPLGNGTYLEVIAVNPDAPAPSRPRWFGLDDPFVKSCLIQQPRLLTWVVNTTRIDPLQSQSLVPLGSIESMSRNDLEWLITIPPDGSLPGSGLIPTLIQWNTPVHPSAKMPPSGCSLVRLELYHSNPRWLENALNTIGAAPHVDIQPLPSNFPPYIVAHIQTPSGLKEISGNLMVSVS